MRMPTRTAGTAMLEIYQNCNIFNDGAFKHFTDKGLRDERTVDLQSGQPLRFGADSDKAVVFDQRMQPGIVQVGDHGVAEAELPGWDPAATSPAAAMALAHASETDLPVPIGVFRDIERPVFEADVVGQIAVAQERKTESLEELMAGGETWVVGG